MKARKKSKHVKVAKSGVKKSVKPPASHGRTPAAKKLVERMIDRLLSGAKA